MRRSMISERGERHWQGIPGLERTAGGRLWASWGTGGTTEPHIDNYVVVTFSDDQGKSWSPFQTFAPESPTARSFDACLWIDPQGKLWLLYNVGDKTNRLHQIVAWVLHDPDADEPRWSGPRVIEIDTPYAFRVNKPTVLANGTWLMPVTHFNEPVPAKPDGSWKDWFSFPNQLQGVARSTDQGRTWRLHGEISAPPWAMECMTLERNDSSLWMLIRTDDGWLWESESTDAGVSWSKGQRSTILSPGSRFHLRRLKDGRVMLVNHMGFKEAKSTRRGRINLSLAVSGDEGRTWSKPLLIEDRDEGAYPDLIQSKDGTLYMINDYARANAGQIMLTIIAPEELPQT